jgi:hypothetical protein
MLLPLLIQDVRSSVAMTPAGSRARASREDRIKNNEISPSTNLKMCTKKIIEWQHMLFFAELNMVCNVLQDL